MHLAFNIKKQEPAPAIVASTGKRENLRNMCTFPSVADPGCLSRIRLFSIPDPNCLHPGSRILKEFKYFNPKKAKKWFLSSKKYDPGCSSRIPDPDADFIPSRIQGSKRHPIPDPGSGSATLLFPHYSEESVL
jgi:hypothetical protein